jgi:hypothetical protein
MEGFLLKLKFEDLKKIKILFKSDKNNSYFRQKPKYIFDYISFSST